MCNRKYGYLNFCTPIADNCKIYVVNYYTKYTLPLFKTLFSYQVQVRANVIGSLAQLWE